MASITPATAWIALDGFQLMYMLIMQFIFDKRSINLKSWDNLGWDFAFVSIILLDSVSIILYIL